MFGGEPGFGADPIYSMTLMPSARAYREHSGNLFVFSA
jgi:hypothetical protein